MVTINNDENKENNILYSPSRLYEDFDDSLPLNAEIRDTELIGNIVFDYVYFDGRKTADGVSRIYCVCAHSKEQTNLPVIVFTTKLGSSIDITRLNSWAMEGYMAVTIDIQGKTDENLPHTVYPPSISYANYSQAKERLYSCQTNARENCWYEWAVSVMRAISYVSTLGIIDINRIGVYSARDSANIAIQIIATDKRVKCGAVLYGNCWQEVDISCEPDINCSDEQMEQKLKCQQERQRYLTGVCPQSFLSLITKPFYFCMGTNSLSTNVDLTRDIINRINNDNKTRMCLFPKLMDVGQITDRRNFTNWLVSTLKNNNDVPLAPTVEINSIDGKLIANVNTNGVKFDKLEVFYTRSNCRSSVRNWVQADNIKDNNFDLIVYCETGIITAFATITLKSGLRLSSDLVSVDLSSYKIVSHRPTKILYSGNDSVGSFVPLLLSGQMTVQTIDHIPVAGVTSLFAIKGVMGKDMATYALTDNKYIFNINSVVNLDVYSEKPQKLTVTLVVNWSFNPLLYRFSVDLLGGNLWQKIAIPLQEFKLENGRTLKENNIVEVLHLHTEDNIVVNNIVFS